MGIKQLLGALAVSTTLVCGASPALAQQTGFMMFGLANDGSIVSNTETSPYYGWSGAANVMPGSNEPFKDALGFNFVETEGNSTLEYTVYDPNALEMFTFIPYWSNVGARAGASPGAIEKVVACSGGPASSNRDAVYYFVLATPPPGSCGGRRNCRTDALVYTIANGISSWTPWSGDLRDSIGDHGVITDIACTRTASGVALATTTADGGLYLTEIGPGNTFSQFDDVTTHTQNTGFYTHVALAYANSYGMNLQLIASTSDDRLYRTTRYTDGTWLGFANVPLPTGETVARLAAQTYWDMEVAVVGGSGNVWLSHNTNSNVTGPWSSWQSLNALWNVSYHFIDFVFAWYVNPNQIS